MNLVIDAEVVLDFLEGDQKTVSILKLAEKLYITIFDYSLLLAGTYKTQNHNHNLYIIREFIKQNIDVLMFEKKEAQVFAKLKNDYPDIDNIVLMKCAILQVNSLAFFTKNDIYKNIKKIKLF